MIYSNGRGSIIDAQEEYLNSTSLGDTIMSIRMTNYYIWSPWSRVRDFEREKREDKRSKMNTMEFRTILLDYQRDKDKVAKTHKLKRFFDSAYGVRITKLRLTNV